jgi:DNA-binding transcriptional LysR family regulator
LHLSQPSVSRTISELEVSLGVKLLVRTNRAVRLTEAGEALLEGAPAAILGMERCFARAREVGRGELGTLTVGFLASVTARLLPPAVTEFHAAYPGVNLELRELHHGALRRALRSGTVDVGILRSHLDEPDFGSELLYEDPIDAVLPLDHVNVSKPSLRFADLRNDSFVLWPRRQSPAGYDQVIVGCLAAGFEPRITQECVLPNTMLGLVAAGAGISVLSSLFRAFRTDVGFVPLVDHPPGSIYVAWRANPPSATRETFVRLIKQAGGQIRAATA